MAQEKISTVLRVGLIIAVIELVFYGLILFLIPTQFFEFIGATPCDAVRARWPGGTLIAIGVGAYLVIRSPAGQGSLVLTITLGFLLSGLAMLYSWVAGEYSSETIQLAIPTILNLVVAALLFMGRQSSRQTLG